MKKNRIALSVSLALSLPLLLTGCSQQSNDSSVAQSSSTPTNVSAEIWPKLDITVKADAQQEAQIEQLLAKMTTEQKVAQVIQPEIRTITVEEMRQYGFGSYLNGGGSFPNLDKHASVQDWVNLAEAMYQASIDDSLDGSSIPTMWGTDAVHGHNNVIGATLFPHNIGLGAANNPELIEKIARATAKEVMATGIDWIFAPTVAVVRNDRWGRTYEGYSEDPAIVKHYSAAIVAGLQGEPGNDLFNDDKVIATVKHFVGDGGTTDGDDQGNTQISEQELFDIHAQGYVGGLEAGAQTVMASFNSWNGVKNHGNPYLLTEVLKERMGFDGLVVGDWEGHGQIPGCSNESCAQAMNAGLDIYMAPGSWKPLYENTLAQVKSGDISMTRLDDAVRRILRVKIRAGLFDKPSPANRPFAGDESIIGHPEHRAIARDAVRQSLVLLKNKNQILPLDPQQKILLAGDGADNIGKQAGGWSITWQGTGNENADFPGATSVYGGFLQRLQELDLSADNVRLSAHGEIDPNWRPDVAVVVFGETPYAEGNGDVDNLEFERGNKQSLALLKRLQSQGIPVVSVFISGRPMWVNPELNASDAFVAAWLPGTEGVGVADVLLGDANGNPAYDFTGRLSYSWPADPTQIVNKGDQNVTPLVPYGYGLSFGESGPLADLLPETYAVEASHKNAPLNIMSGGVKPPWFLQLSGSGQQQIASSNVTHIEGLSVSTTDRRVQEDALHIEWRSDESAYVSISQAFPQDLRGFGEKQGAIQFDLKLIQSSAPSLSLMMGCAENCQNGLSLNSLLDATDQWQTLSVPIACFDNVDLAQVFTPFALSATGELTIELSDVRIVTDAQSNCPAP